MTSQNHADPTASNVNIDASVAYATEDMTSLEKTGNAFQIGRRSPSSASVWSGRPNT